MHSALSLSLVLQDKTHLMCSLGVPLLYRGRGRGPSRPSPLLLASTRALASDACGAMYSGRQLRWHGGGAFTKICMPPRRRSMSWLGSCMLPRRCLPSWLGWQLHVNGGGSLVGMGLAVALLASLVRALSGGPARVLPCGPARVLSCGPARVLPWRAVVPDKDLAGGLVGSFGEDGCLPILI